MPVPRSQSTEHQIYYEGTHRVYRVHLPVNHDSSNALPLVLVFHGGGGTAMGMERITAMNDVSDANGFIAVYPEALKKLWNDGRLDVPQRARHDDAGFIGDVIVKLSSDYKIDSGRVYACGLSNGGFFSQHLACCLPDKIAAVASVAASVPMASQCAPSRPLPVIFFLGDNDPVVPYEGGEINGLYGGVRGGVLSAPDSVNFWTNHNQCAATPSRTFTEELGSQLTLEAREYSSPQIETCVAVYTVRGGGHTWPGGQQYLPVRIVGPTAKALPASSLIWKFFSNHCLKVATGSPKQSKR